MLKRAAVTFSISSDGFRQVPDVSYPDLFVTRVRYLGLGLVLVLGLG